MLQRKEGYTWEQSATGDVSDLRVQFPESIKNVGFFVMYEPILHSAEGLKASLASAERR